MHNQGEIQRLISKTPWINLGKGNYNYVQVSTKTFTLGEYEGRWVLKRPISMSTDTDSYINAIPRAIRKWRTLNPKYPVFKIPNGWIAPYLGQTQASDEQIARKLIEIYRDTRNIVADAPAKKNFIVYEGEVICIDVDHAFRRGSEATDRFDAKNNTKYETFLEHYSEKYPKTIDVIETLFYLENNIADADIDDKFITVEIIEKLNQYRKKLRVINVETLEQLLEKDSVTLAEPSSHGFPSSYLAPAEEKSPPFIRPHFSPPPSPPIIYQVSSPDYMHIDTPRAPIHDEIAALIRRNQDSINNIDENGFTLLQLAIIHNEHKIALLLIAHDVNIKMATNNQYGVVTAIDLAVIYKRKRLVELLLEIDPDAIYEVQNKQKLLEFAEKNGLSSVVKTLTDAYPLIREKEICSTEAGEDERKPDFLLSKKSFFPPSPTKETREQEVASDCYRRHSI